MEGKRKRESFFLSLLMPAKKKKKTAVGRRRKRKKWAKVLLRLLFLQTNKKIRSPQQHGRPVAPQVQHEIIRRSSIRRRASSRSGVGKASSSAEEGQGRRRERGRRRRSRVRPSPSFLLSGLFLSASSPSSLYCLAELPELPRAHGHQRRRPHQGLERLEAGPGGRGALLGGVPRRGRRGRVAGEGRCGD